MRIVSMDGGGVLSLLTLAVLRRVEEARPGFLALAEGFAGTSAGGISALILANCDDMLEGLRVAASVWDGTVPIYSDSKLRALGALKGLVAQNSADGLRDFLEGQFGATTLGELKRCVAIASFDVNGGPDSDVWRAKIFNNIKIFSNLRSDDLDDDEPVVHVGLATTAFPMTFPVHRGYIDGGIFANNPSMAALVHVVRAHRMASAAPMHVGVALDRVSMLSVGTGAIPATLKVGTADWGYAQWLFNPQMPLAFVEAAYASNAETSADYCSHLLGEQYLRFNPALGGAIGVAERHGSGSSVDRMREAALAAGESADISPILAWIDAVGWMDAAVSPGTPSDGPPPVERISVSPE